MESSPTSSAKTQWTSAIPDKFEIVWCDGDEEPCWAVEDRVWIEIGGAFVLHPQINLTFFIENLLRNSKLNDEFLSREI